MDDQLPKQGDTEPTAPHNKGANAENDKIDSVAERVIAALTKINRANRKADATENERNHRREKRRFKVEIIEIGLIAVYAFFTILEWQTFDRERVTMETELRASQTSASVQYDIAIKQLDEIRQANQLDQRAWVAVTEIKFDFSSQQSGQDPFGVVFTEIFKNTGKTPAVNVTPVVSIYDDIKRIPKSDTFPNPVYTSTLLPPDGVAEIPPTVGPEPQIYQAIKACKTIYVAGTIWYDDIFRSNHWSQFCWQITPDFHPKPMAFHFSCDDAEANKSK